MKRSHEITEELIDAVRARLAANEAVRRTLPEQGRLHIDRPLPFLCVYRRRPDDAGTDRLVTGEASYLIAPSEERHRRGVTELLHALVEDMAEQFGAFLLLEVWSDQDGGAGSDASRPSVPPSFRIIAPESAPPARTLDVLAQRLSRIKVLRQEVEVEIDHDGHCHPPGMEPLLDPETAARHQCSVLGLVVPPVYRAAGSQQEFPPLLRSFRHALGQALKPAFYRFVRSQTVHRPPHYHELGRRAVVKAVWEVDRRLSQVSNEFDFLLQVSPINTDGAWREFEHREFERAPEFHYRPTPFDPGHLKRQLYDIPMDRVEDPALQNLFQEKQEEIDRKITMLRDLNTPRFLYGSMQVYGTVGAEMLAMAGELLDRAPRRRARSGSGKLDARGFAARAEREFERYRGADPSFAAKTRLTRKVAGIMVSRGTLLINPGTTVPDGRVEALIQHEVGTHLLTYFNGSAQPFRQLQAGLAGYEELQEGLAVLTEYLVGGLSPGRMRQLAARVLAVRHLTDGASFVETFRALLDASGLGPKSTFKVTMRVYRGGGLTKDAVYLRGLGMVLKYLGGGGEIAPLLVGKIGLEHVAIVKELLHRQVLKPARIGPAYLEDEAVKERLERLRGAPTSISDLLEPPAAPATSQASS